MSTMRRATTTHQTDQADGPRDVIPPNSRLASVELRKLVDTRAGFWLLAATTFASVTAAVLRLCLGSGSDRTFENVYTSAELPLSLLLPVIGILLMTEEWSRRTALTTFTLVPQRTRVLGAKIDALVTLAIGGWLAALGASAAAFAAGRAFGVTTGGWSFPMHMIKQMTLGQVCAVLIGAAFGLLLRRTAPAVVLYFLLPTAVSIIAELAPGASGAMDWLAPTHTLDPLMTSHALTGQEWAQLGTTMALWSALPMVIGIWQLNRKEIG